MFWKKPKKMIDVRELQKRGVMRIPRNSVEVPTDKDGFVEIGQNTRSTPSTTAQTFSESDSEGGNFMSFMDNPSTPTSTISSSSLNNSQKISTQISDMDNKIYKLEQRIELLERKLGVRNSQVGAAGW